MAEAAPEVAVVAEPAVVAEAAPDVATEAEPGGVVEPESGVAAEAVTATDEGSGVLEEDDLRDIDEIPDEPGPIVILPEIPPKAAPGAAVKTCSRCGAVLKINVRFCGSCGHAN